MGTFDSPSDAPFQIKTEGETITLSFLPGLPVTGQGTVQWNIPGPARGCQTGDLGAYCGIVVLLSTTALQPANAPVDGTYYTADATADLDMHTGDKIGGALVVGAFYEGEKRSRGEALTDCFVISDLKQNTPYYVAAYAVDCQGRYHTKGVRAYSDNYGGPEDPSIPSTQTVVIGTNGALPTDGTGLTPGLIYEFEIELDPTFPTGTDKRTVKFSVDGINISTYEDLLKEINKAFALADNPPQSPIAPNSGRYYWDALTQKLYQWDGNTHVPVNALVEPTDPSTPATDSYWYDTAGAQLKQWTGSPAAWTDVATIKYKQDPRALMGGDDVWFDGTNAYSWCGGTWCQEALHDSATDPSVVVYPTNCGEYWYDETNQQLYEWNVEESRWVERYAIYWNVAPNALTSGTYWFDSATEKLFTRAGSPLSWDEILTLASTPAGSPITPRLVISETQPTSPINELHWYKASTEQLFVWNGSAFVETPVLVWPTDPTDIETCELWWNSVDDKLYKWDIVHSEWDEATPFTKSLTDPYAQPTFDLGELWYNPTTELMYSWDGVIWTEISYISFLTDPTQPTTGTAWYNTETNMWAIWDSPLATQWNTINPIDSPVDPLAIVSGTLWYDVTNNTLYERVGTSWVATPFSTIPFTPAKGDLWFDITNNILKEWDGTAWVAASVLAVAELDTIGNLKITSTFTGSNSCVMILIPQGSISGVNSNGLATGTAGHDFLNYGIYYEVPTSTTTVSPSQFLFDFLLPKATITRQIYGADGIDSTPSYDQLGVGDDGSADERRDMANIIRAQLGAPTVEVELTPFQIDTAIDLALQSLRKRSGTAYKRGFFFLDIQPGYQHYKLTDQTVGFHKVVTVMSAYRFTSAFLSTAYGSGVYGQVVLQHLYNMGTFDLLSYHLVAQYVEQLEHLFATRLTYNWNESSRLLSFYNSFARGERVLLDVTVERTEQEILKDRWTRTWIERYALAESMRMLAQVRGKYASLPGAGGGISLNAMDLMAQHDTIKEQLYQQIDDLVVNSVEDIGMQSAFIIG